MAATSARKKIWGWYFFDWASQPYNTLLLTFIFGPYFAQTATANLVDSGILGLRADGCGDHDRDTGPDPWGGG